MPCPVFAPREGARPTEGCNLPLSARDLFASRLSNSLIMQTRNQCRIAVSSGGKYILADEQPSAPEVLERLIQQAERAEASDIHLHMRHGSAGVSFRLDGVMSPVTELPAEVA